MSVSVSMPQLGESVTEGTVTRWLKKEGERVEADEPLLEVSTDKVDTEIPSPASGILRGIVVDEDETVAVGAQLAVIEDSETSESASAGASPAGDAPPQDNAESAAPADSQPAEPQPAEPQAAEPQAADSRAADSPQAAPAEPAPAASSDRWNTQPNYAPPAQSAPSASPPPDSSSQVPGYAPPPAYGQAPHADVYSQSQPAPHPAADQSAGNGHSAATASAPPAAQEDTASSAEDYPPPTPLPGAGDAPYVTPLVRKLAAEHAVDLEKVTGTGVGGRIRKQDVIEVSKAQRAAQPQSAQPAAAAQPAASAQPSVPAQPSAPAQPAQAPAAAQPSAPPAAAAQQTQAPQPAVAVAAPARPSARRPVEPSTLRGTTQRMSRARQVISQRMVESLHVSAQLTTVVEADVTAIARLRQIAKRDFEAREGVKLSFLPFFALAAVEALKVHPKVNAVIDGDQVTYHDAEHVGIAVDTERGLMVPVIHNAGDLNIGGLARKISDLADRTRSGRVGPDELAGGTFTLTNTGSRGALFDTPIINQPQVAILGTGTVVKRPVVVEDPALGEVIAVRSMVYLALTYDHRLVDGADAARFLTTVKNRLEEGAFEAELGL
jgi:2-oxoglutarate dehydrogenase E2 component (dihydrolipoamide succinyltransferase)